VPPSFKLLGATGVRDDSQVGPNGAGVVALALTITSATTADGHVAHKATKAPCVAKPVTVAGSIGTQFCGPASATVKVGGKSYSFRAGFCAHDLQNQLALELSLGTDVPVFGRGKPNHGRPLFELTLTTTAQQGSLLALDVDGRKLVAGDTRVDASYNASAALQGTFRGKGVSGAWNCHGGIYKLDQG
jgi:hypothetical protein